MPGATSAKFKGGTRTCILFGKIKMSQKSSYIQEKEAFVSGHHGTSWLEVQLFITNTVVRYVANC